MLIINGNKLIQHFEHVVDVHLFTVPNILTIINTFSVEVPDGSKIINADKLIDNIENSYLTQGEKRLLKIKVNKEPDIFGGSGYEQTQ